MNYLLFEDRLGHIVLSYRVKSGIMIEVSIKVPFELG